MLGLLLALAPVVPPAERPRPAAIELQWQAPSECPDVETMRQRIAALTLDPAGEGTLRVDGRVEETSVGYRLSLSTMYGSVSDTRVVVDGDCDALGDAAALVVVVSLDPASEPTEVDAVPDPTPPEPEPEPLPAVAVNPEADRDEQPPPVTPPSDETPPLALRPDAVALGLGGQLEFGALPGLSGGPRLELEVQWQRLSIAAHGAYGAPRRTDAVQGVSGLAQIGAAGVRGCGVVGDAVRVPLCALVEGGGLRVESRGPVPNNVLRYPWAAAGAHVGLEGRWGRVGLYAAGEAVVPISRNRVKVGDTASFTTFAVSVRAVLGLRIFFDTDPA